MDKKHRFLSIRSSCNQHQDIDRSSWALAGNIRHSHGRSPRVIRQLAPETSLNAHELMLNKGEIGRLLTSNLFSTGPFFNKIVGTDLTGQLLGQKTDVEAIPYGRGVADVSMAAVKAVSKVINFIVRYPNIELLLERVWMRLREVVLHLSDLEI